MTAKQKLRERIEALTEEEASEALRLLDPRSDPVIAAFRDAPPSGDSGSGTGARSCYWTPRHGPSTSRACCPAAAPTAAKSDRGPRQEA